MKKQETFHELKSKVAGNTIEQWFSIFLSPGPTLKNITLHRTHKHGHRQDYYRGVHPIYNHICAKNVLLGRDKLRHSRHLKKIENHCSIAVSYTHLDVYKRQTISCFM